MYANGIDNIWAADLVDVRNLSNFNKGIQYLLTVIDIFSKYGWIIPINNKSGKEVKKALQIILKERQPSKMWVDKGKEFYNKDVQSLIELYSTENEEKSCVVERWNRTMKEQMYKYFTANSTKKYINILPSLVNQYNNTFHSSIKMTPIQGSKKKNENIVFLNLYPDLINKQTTKKHKYSVGDKVRITKKRGIFDKGYAPRWTEEVFTISSLQFTDPPTYKITDYNNEEIQGTFYEQELQKSNQEVYRIEKVMKRRKNKSLVKWKGYPDSFNSWIDNAQQVKLSD